jgi:hypothetical protein
MVFPISPMLATAPIAAIPTMPFMALNACCILFPCAAAVFPMLVSSALVYLL